jgi:hypothetical protein
MSNRYIAGVIHSLTEPILRDLPREIRDMVYQELCDESDEPFYVIDNNGMPPWSNEYCFEPLIEMFQLPYWMNPERVGEEFATEAAQIWHRMARISVDITLLSSLMYDVGGVLVGSRGPRMKAKELIRNLDVCMSDLPHYNTYGEETLPSDKAAPYYRAARGLSTLLGPTGIKHKQAFKLHLIIPSSSRIVLERYAEALGPIVSLLREEGFVVTGALHHGSLAVYLGVEDVTSYFEPREEMGDRLLEE